MESFRVNAVRLKSCITVSSTICCQGLTLGRRRKNGQRVANKEQDGGLPRGTFL